MERLTERERLIELIKEMIFYPEKTCLSKDDCYACPHYDKGDCDRFARKADYLLANGVIVLPSKPGDTVYWIEYITENGEVKGKIKSGTIWNYKYENYLSVAIHTSKTKCIVLRAEFIYTSPEAAEQALKERENE